MTTSLRFVCGFCGSMAVELVLLNQCFQDEADLPRRYKTASFWVVRILLAVLAGGLALAYNIDNPVLALNVGAATPLIIRAFAHGGIGTGKTT
jgi:hypothetical protein